MRRGLVLEGGAMRGMFTAGVIDVMMENGITYDGIVGVSAGAVFGCNYKSGQIGRTIRYNTKYCRDKRYCSLRSLLKTGDLYGADFCYRQLPEELDKFDIEAYQKNPTAFYVVCTDVETGMPIYKRCDRGTGEELLWMRGSASLPFVSRPVEVDGRLLLDGGMSDSIPLRFFEGIGYNRNVVVLTRPRTYVKKKSRFRPLMRMALRKYPFLADAVIERPEAYNEAVRYISEREEKGEVFVLRPERELDVRRTEKNPEKLWEAYREGRKTAEKNMDALRAYLEE